MSGFFGEKRALTSVEISHLFLNVQTNAIGKVLMTAFAQNAQQKEVKQYLVKGKQIAGKHIDIFSNYLIKEDLPAPMSWDSAVTDATTNVFSDKLVMFHVSAMIADRVGNYGMAMAASQEEI